MQFIDGLTYLDTNYIEAILHTGGISLIISILWMGATATFAYCNEVTEKYIKLLIISIGIISFLISFLTSMNDIIFTENIIYKVSASEQCSYAQIDKEYNIISNEENIYYIKVRSAYES